MEIRKWHLYVADLNPRMGTEPGKVRPVVVVQRGPEARYLRVHLARGEAGVKEPSDIMVDQVRAIDNRRLITRLGVISRRSQVRLASNLRILLT